MRDFGDIGVTEEQIDLLNVAEDFARDKSPIEKVRKLMESDLGYDPDVWAEMGQLGWLGIAIPEEYDGVGLSLAEVVPVAEQLGKRMLNSPFLPTTLAAQAIIAGGTETQKSDILPKIAAGNAATMALSEPHGDWNILNIEASAKRTDGGFELSGTKTFVQDLESAKSVIISANLGGDAALFVVNNDMIPEGASRRETNIDETKRTWELSLDGITVPENTLMDTDKAEAALTHVHLAANLLSAAEMTGACKATIEYTVEYLKTRKQFGRLIGSYQALKHPTVDAFVGYEQARSLLYAAAHSFDNQGAGEVATRMAKAQADTALSFASDRAIQFHGGFGFTYDCDAQLYRRKAIFHASQYGDAAYHRAKLADLLL